METTTAAETTTQAIARARVECMKVHAGRRVECNREPGHKGQHRYTFRGRVVHAWTSRRTSRK